LKNGQSQYPNFLICFLTFTHRGSSKLAQKKYIAHFLKLTMLFLSAGKAISALCLTSLNAKYETFLLNFFIAGTLQQIGQIV
jgi:hypothetical protein